MSNVKINCIISENNKTELNEILIRNTKLIDSKSLYSTCPVFNHKSNRTFVGVSPFDISFKIDRENKLISVDGQNFINYEQSNNNFGPYSGLNFSPFNLNGPSPLFEISYPRLFFWTDIPNIWMEFNDHPMTSLNNNFVAVSGWFNLSNWKRNIALVVTMIDETKPITIKKGDPLFRLSFYPPNLDSGIILKKESNQKKINKLLSEYGNTDDSRDNWKSKLFSKTPIKKCPFKFLHK
jgi:hypothetical protein